MTESIAFDCNGARLTPGCRVQLIDPDAPDEFKGAVGQVDGLCQNKALRALNVLAGGTAPLLHVTLDDGPRIHAEGRHLRRLDNKSAPGKKDPGKDIQYPDWHAIAGIKEVTHA